MGVFTGEKYVFIELRRVTVKMDIDVILKNVDRLYEEKKPEDAEALLYQEMGEFDKAPDNLYKALRIVTAIGNKYEEAVSRANPAGTLVQLGSFGPYGEDPWSERFI